MNIFFLEEETYNKIAFGECTSITDADNEDWENVHKGDLVYFFCNGKGVIEAFVEDIVNEFTVVFRVHSLKPIMCEALGEEHDSLRTEIRDNAHDDEFFESSDDPCRPESSYELCCDRLKLVEGLLRAYLR